MGVAPNWLKPGSLNFFQVCIMVFRSFFENTKIITYCIFNLEPNEGRTFSFKIMVFDMHDFILISVLNEIKTN